VALSPCEGSHLGFCSVKCQLPSFCPVEAQTGTGFQFPDDLVYVTPQRHPSDILHNKKAFESGDSLLIALYQRWRVNCEEDQRHLWTSIYTSVCRVSLNHLNLNYHLEHLVWKTTLPSIVWWLSPFTCLSLLGSVSFSLCLGKLPWCPSGVHMICGFFSRLRVLCWPWLPLCQLLTACFCFHTRCRWAVLVSQPLQPVALQPLFDNFPHTG